LRKAKNPFEALMREDSQEGMIEDQKTNEAAKDKGDFDNEKRMNGAIDDEGDFDQETKKKKAVDDEDDLQKKEEEMERRFQQREREMREKEKEMRDRMNEEFQLREEELRWKLHDEKNDDEVKDQMKDLRGANADLRRQLITMMELQGQMMKSMNEKTKKGTESFTLGDDDEEDAQETVRWSGGALQLPKLEYGQQDNAMECGDWMAKVAITMRDLSKNSHVWWDIVVKDAEEAYQKYMRSSPLVKLEVEAELEEASKYLRLRSKATSILLDAIPKDISAEAVAAREIHPTQLLYAIMKKFQPGGLEERSQLLSRIEEVNACKTCEEAVKATGLFTSKQNRNTSPLPSPPHSFEIMQVKTKAERSLGEGGMGVLTCDDTGLRQLRPHTLVA
jgi:predicted enzyme related to lactoylglutathione lyase